MPCPYNLALMFPGPWWKIAVRFEVGAPDGIAGGGDEFGIADIGDILGPEGTAAQAQAALLWRAIAFVVITLGAAAHQVVPLAGAAAVLGQHVIDSQRDIARAAVLAGVFIPGKNGFARHPQHRRGPAHVVVQPHHGGHLHADPLGVEHLGVALHHVRFPQIKQTQGTAHVGHVQRLVVVIED